MIDANDLPDIVRETLDLVGALPWREQWGQLRAEASVCLSAASIALQTRDDGTVQVFLGRAIAYLTAAQRVKDAGRASEGAGG